MTLNKKNGSGNSPLHLAFQFGHTEIVALLLKQGADPTIKNNAQMAQTESGLKFGRGNSLAGTLKGASEVPVKRLEGRF